MRKRLESALQGFRVVYQRTITRWQATTPDFPTHVGGIETRNEVDQQPVEEIASKAAVGPRKIQTASDLTIPLDRAGYQYHSFTSGHGGN
jgi:hypothetical protein